MAAGEFPEPHQMMMTWAGDCTFARLPRRTPGVRADLAVIGVPYDLGVTPPDQAKGVGPRFAGLDTGRRCWFFARETQAADRPSRPAYDKCKWEKLSDEKTVISAWVQPCDYGFRKIDFLFEGKSLMVRFSDGGKPEPLVDVIDITPTVLDIAGVEAPREYHGVAQMPLHGVSIATTFVDAQADTGHRTQ